MSNQDHSPGTGEPTIATITAKAQALIASATQATGSATPPNGASLALAALQTPDPQQALMLLAASSAHTSIEQQATREQDRIVQQQAEFRTQMVEESVNNSDHTFEKRWRQQAAENQVLKERVERLETVVRRLAEVVVQMRGGEADEVAGLFGGLEI